MKLWVFVLLATLLPSGTYAQRSCDGKLIKLRHQLLCNHFLTHDFGTHFADYDPAVLVRNDNAVKDIKSADAVQDDIWQMSFVGSPKEKEKLVQEIHAELISIVKRDGYHGNPSSTPEPMALATTESEYLKVLNGIAREIIAQRTNGNTISFSNDSDNVLNAHLLADNICNYNHISCKEPKHK